MSLKPAHNPAIVRIANGLMKLSMIFTGGSVLANNKEASIICLVIGGVADMLREMYGPDKPQV